MHYIVEAIIDSKLVSKYQEKQTHKSAQKPPKSENSCNYVNNYYGDQICASCK